VARKPRRKFRLIRPQRQPNARRVDQWKPKGYEDWLTLGELSFVVNRHKDYLRRLERQERIPLPKRVTRGELEIRLYSPFVVGEIKEILSLMKPGRPRK